MAPVRVLTKDEEKRGGPIKLIRTKRTNRTKTKKEKHEGGNFLEILTFKENN